MSGYPDSDTDSEPEEGHICGRRTKKATSDSRNLEIGRRNLAIIRETRYGPSAEVTISGHHVFLTGSQRRRVLQEIHDFCSKSYPDNDWDLLDLMIEAYRILRALMPGVVPAFDVRFGFVPNRWINHWGACNPDRRWCALTRTKRI